MNDENELIADDEQVCPNCNTPGSHAVSEHTCPYAEDINGDHDSLCRCCDTCTRQCADDI